MLFEPTNIIPSTLTNTGTVAVADAINIEWQVNGNSAMTKFQIDVFENNADSTFVYSTGIVSSNAAPYSLPFYGKDRFGEYIPFSYEPRSGVQGITWTNWGLFDGDNYKYKITQWYAANNSVVQKTLSNNLTEGNGYYFTYSEGGTTYYLYFSVSDASIFATGNTINYSISNQNAWVIDSTNTSNPRMIEISMGRATEAPGDGYTLLGGTVATVVSSGEAFTAQNSASAIITRTAPVLSVTITDQAGSPISNNTVTSASVFATGTYTQAQDDNIRWVRWQLANVDSDGSVNTTQILDDTGEIYTPLLQYSYNGLFNGESAASPAKYAINCTVQTENGVDVSSGWIVFDVYYQANQYTGEFTAQMLCDDDCNYLSWDALESIPGIASPENGVTVSGGNALIQEGATLTWSTKNDTGDTSEPINFPAPWTAVWKGSVEQLAEQFINEVKIPGNNPVLGDSETVNKNGSPIGGGPISAASFNQDGSVLIISGTFSGYASIFSITNNTAVYVRDIPAVDGSALDGYANVIQFSHSGNRIFISGIFSDNAILYDLDGTTLSNPVRVTYGSDTSYLCAAFSLNDSVLFAGGDTSAYATGIFNLTSTSATPVGQIQVNGRNIVGSVRNMVLSPDGNTLYLGGELNSVVVDEHLAVFSVSGTNVTFVSCPERLGGYEDGVWRLALSPDGTILVVSGDFNGYASIFDVNGSSVVYREDLTINGEALPERASSMIFSTYYGNFAISFYYPSTKISFFSVANGNFNYLFDVQNNGENFSGYGASMAFVPNGRLLFVGRVQTISSDDTAYLVEIENSNSNPVSLISTYTGAMNPDKTLLVLGGNFPGNASLFSVSGNNVSYLSDIMRGPFLPLGGTVTCAAFSPDGNWLVLGGTFLSRCALFSVGNNSVQFVGYVSLSIINNTVNTVSFINNNQFVVGGAFTNAAALFTASSNGITFVSYLRKNNFSITGTIYGSAVSPDGSDLILCGSGSGSVSGIGAAVYSISGSTLTYLNELPGVVFNGTVRGITFSNSGDSVVVYGDFTQRARIFYRTAAHLYSFGTNLTKNGSSLTQNVVSAVFFEEDRWLMLSSGELYNAYNSSITYVTDVFPKIAQISSEVVSTMLPVNGNTILLGGSVLGANLIAVSDENIVNGNLFNIQSDNIVISRYYEFIRVTRNGVQLSTAAISGSSGGAADSIAIAFTANQIQVYSYYNGNYIGVSSGAITSSQYTQGAVSSAQLTGEQICDYFAIASGNGEAYLSNLQNPDYEFSWNSTSYTLYLNATFANGIDGGTGSSAGTGFRVYRSSGTTGEYKQIATVGANVTELKDYGIQSGEEYTYYLYAYDSGGGFMGVRQTEPLKRRFKRVSLVVAEYADTDNVYHVVKEYHFALNVENMTVSNNNSPQFSQNFTPYPTRFLNSANYASGTLQSLIGAVDTKTMQYVDTAQLMDELNALSTSQYVLFLKDMKGHLRLVHTGGTIQQTPYQKSVPMQVTISLPWTEIGDASLVSIVSVPGDEGWNYDDEVLNVKLDVDMANGRLNVYYPLLYQGTRFSMDAEGRLNAKTPTGITPADFTLSEVAIEPDDGELTAEPRDE